MSYYPEFGAESFADIFRLAFSYIYVGIWFSFIRVDIFLEKLF
jgi:hypothetical protein